MPKPKLLSTGIKELDEIVGGYPEGSFILVAGHPGAGKTTLAAHFIHKGLVNGERGLWISLGEAKKDFNQMSMLGFVFQEFEKQGLFKFLWVPLIQDIEQISDTIVKMMLEERFSRIVIDPITPLIMSLGRQTGRAFLHNVINLGVKPTGSVLVALAELPYGASIIGYGFEEFVADAIITLTLDVYRGLPYRTISIRKVRWAPISKMEYAFGIDSYGIRIYKEYTGGVPGTFQLEERHSTGISELDSMLRGGIPKGSAVIIAGPSGSGKTTLSLSIVNAEIRRGGRPLFISFEESATQIKYVAKLLGVTSDFEVRSLSPRYFTPASLYYYVMNLVESISPTLIIIDGTAAIFREFKERDGIDIIRALGQDLKIKGITEIMTTVQDILVKGEELGISTIADIIIALGFKLDRDRVRRLITILKARGIPPDTRIRELIFEPDNIRII
jgi:circadian clock protein KaiC